MKFAIGINRIWIQSGRQALFFVALYLAALDVMGGRGVDGGKNRRGREMMPVMEKSLMSREEGVEGGREIGRMVLISGSGMRKWSRRPRWCSSKFQSENSAFVV